jgi:hypothetical protein
MDDKVEVEALAAQTESAPHFAIPLPEERGIGVVTPFTGLPWRQVRPTYRR